MPGGQVPSERGAKKRATHNRKVSLMSRKLMKAKVDDEKKEEMEKEEEEEKEEEYKKMVKAEKVEAG